MHGKATRQIIQLSETRITQVRSQTSGIRSGIAGAGRASSDNFVPAEILVTGCTVPNRNYYDLASSNGSSVRATPSTKAPSTTAPARSKDDIARKEARNIVYKALITTDPVAALRVINDGYNRASWRVRNALLSDAGAQEIFREVAKEINRVSFDREPNLNLAVGLATDSFNKIKKGLHLRPEIENAILSRVVNDSQPVMSLRTVLSPKAGVAFDRLLIDANLIGLPLATRVALISQIKNYCSETNEYSEAVINNLRLLAGRGWFQKFSLDDQMRMAKVIAYASQYTGGDRTIIDNTLAYIVGPHSKVKWDDLCKKGREAVNRKSGKGYVKCRAGEFYDGIISLDRALVSADNNKLRQSGEDEAAIDVIAQGVEHEVNHRRNPIVDDNYKELRYEYLAYLVSYRAMYGYEASQRKSYIIIHNIIVTPDIKRTLLSNSPESKKMVQLIAAIAGLDHPERATLQDIIDFDNKFSATKMKDLDQFWANPDLYVTELLSDTKPAVYPGDVDGMPDNRDNHF